MRLYRTNDRNFATVRGMNSSAPFRLSLWQVLVCSAAVIALSLGIRHGFGLWLQPITQAQGWTRADFAFAIAVQNLSWGVLGVFALYLQPDFVMDLANQLWGCF